MEKIKNIISGHKDETNTHESATHTTGTPEHTTGLAGEGSHLSKDTHTTGGLSGQHSVGQTGTTGLTDRNTADDGILRSSGGGILNNSGNQGNLTGQGSHLGSARDAGHTGTEQNQHSGIGYEGTSTNPSGLTQHTGQTGHSGPHQSEAGNLLDPNIKSGHSNTEDPYHHSNKHAGGVEKASSQHAGTGVGSAHHDTTTSGNHLGRDAAIGAGGVGLAQHEHNKHQTQGTTGVGSTGIHSEHQPGAVAGLDGPAPHTAGPHKQDWLNKLDPRVNANPETATTGSGPFKVSAADYPSGTSGPNDPTTGHIANPAHHGVTSANPDGSTTKTANPAHESGVHHRAVPGVPGVTYGNTPTTGTHDTHNKQSTGGLLSFLHRDKNKKYTKEEEDEFDRQEREHNSSHKGAAALGGAAAGGAAHSQYKSDQHQHASEHGINKDLPTAPGNHGIGTGAGTHNALAEKPAGQDLGDKLHGTERNRGVTGASGFPDSEGFGSSTTGTSSGVGHTGHTGEQSHLGRDAALGAGGVGAAEHEHRKHEGLTGTHSQGLAGSGDQYDAHSSTLPGHRKTHLGDSGLGGENEYRKTDTTSGLTSHPGHESGITGTQGPTGQESGIADDRNRLHKDAPSGHVPASGFERERLVGEGERGIDGHTGVKGSHSNAPNTAVNY